MRLFELPITEAILVDDFTDFIVYTCKTKEAFDTLCEYFDSEAQEYILNDETLQIEVFENHFISDGKHYHRNENHITPHTDSVHNFATLLTFLTAHSNNPDVLFVDDYYETPRYVHCYDTIDDRTRRELMGLNGRINWTHFDETYDEPYPYDDMFAFGK